jgi:hypothetical protein
MLFGYEIATPTSGRRGKRNMFDPTSRADVTLTSVHDCLHGEHRSAVRIHSKCVKYQHRLCCDGVELLQRETVRCLSFTFRHLWAPAERPGRRGQYPYWDFRAWLQWKLTVRGQNVCVLLSVSWRRKKRYVGGLHLLEVITFPLSVYRCWEHTRAPYSVRVICPKK